VPPLTFKTLAVSPLAGIRAGLRLIHRQAWRPWSSSEHSGADEARIVCGGVLIDSIGYSMQWQASAPATRSASIPTTTAPPTTTHGPTGVGARFDGRRCLRAVWGPNYGDARSAQHPVPPIAAHLVKASWQPPCRACDPISTSCRPPLPDQPGLLIRDPFQFSTVDADHPACPRPLPRLLRRRARRRRSARAARASDRTGGRRRHQPALDHGAARRRLPRRSARR
jgi:hypothetical protein